MTLAYWWFLLALAGGLGGAYLLRKNLGQAGITLGGSSLVLGGIGVVSSFYGGDGLVAQAIIIGWLLVLATTIFLTYRKIRALFFLTFPIFLSVRAFVPSLPLFVLFASLTLLVTLVDSFDFSRVDITACMKQGEGGLRLLLVPFSRLEILVRRASRGKNSKGQLLMSYLVFFSVVLVGFPLLVYLLSGEVIVGDIALFASLTYLGVAREGYAKATNFTGD